MLARCYNNLQAHERVFELLAGIDVPLAAFERGVALEAAGRLVEAEREYRAELAHNLTHFRSFMKLAKIMRLGGRVRELLDLCDALASQGIDHARMFVERGVALALTGRTEEARRLLFDPSRVTVTRANADGVGTDAFNAALADDLLQSSFVLSSFAPDVANSGGTRVHALLSGRRPDLVQLLFAFIQSSVEQLVAWLPVDDAWARAAPARARINAWAVIQRTDAFERWHTHPSGWISGVYYARIPRVVTRATDGRGCIEFGPPPSLARQMAGAFPTWRHLPKEGELLLAPSHYHHRTIPTGAEEPRVSLAFDIVPVTD